ncbi:E3 ubiquitin-protein ligase WAV3-like isoform X2 [Gastrolobium bilobum]|uniref:E3 ubiquitin-protein ligase WAV3-like isoform X2 n=1 Tax=Gastrolobium bilobum TaxID=150636 RepID=UPI002AAF5034|nr:E3 ubiquitin-protein ligase WAV3-like isoform X2 [Gastrolobium bilobum]
MGSKWKKAKVALGLNLCMFVPRTLDDDSPPATVVSERLSDAALLSPANWDTGSSRSTTPVPSLHGLKLSKSASKSSKQTCPICLTKMKQGSGHAIFTAECSHSFHFHCIASNVKHGNQICPVCRAKWKEIPLSGPSLDPIPARVSPSPVNWPQNDALMAVVHRLPLPLPLPHPRRDLNRRHIVPLYQASEPGLFDDDESLNHQPAVSERSPCNKSTENTDAVKAMEIKTYPEVSAAPGPNTYSNFTVLVHLKATAAAAKGQNLGRNQASLTPISQTPRAPVDLVTVLDVSGSMAGTKLALLKRAMGFVIQNLGTNDRLSVIAFSSTARRLFPLCKMTDSGRQLALQAVNSLVANGGTNIAEGLRKGAKIMEDRKEKNPVASIILLSDGQDNYTVSGSETQPKDAFAQCIGGLLSVVVQELQVEIECIHPNLSIVSLKAGSYPSRMVSDGRKGFIDVGDLYADEERDFLVSVNVPATSGNETSLIKVKCVYKDPLTQETAILESEEVKIERPEIAGEVVMSLEVDRQRNRLQAAEAMAEARVAAEQGDLTGAVLILENCRKMLAETISAKSHDRLCVALDAELKEMQERMASRHVYEASGRAYILSGLSSHSWQRATARGDSTDRSSLVQAYQTPSMAEMLTRSQAMLLGSPSGQRLLQPLLSFRSQPSPR